MSVLGIRFKYNFWLIPNIQIISNKIVSESAYLLKYIQKVYLA